MLLPLLRALCPGCESFDSQLSKAARHAEEAAGAAGDGCPEGRARRDSRTSPPSPSLAVLSQAFDPLAGKRSHVKGCRSRALSQLERFLRVSFSQWLCQGDPPNVLVCVPITLDFITV